MFNKLIDTLCMIVLLLIATTCSSIESFPHRACVFDGRGHFVTGTVLDKREDGAHLFKYDDRSLGDLGYMWIAEHDPSRQLRPCVVASPLTPSADAPYPRGDLPHVPQPNSHHR